jgi:spore coat protein CotH
MIHLRATPSRFHHPQRPGHAEESLLPGFARRFVLLVLMVGVTVTGCDRKPGARAQTHKNQPSANRSSLAASPLATPTAGETPDVPLPVYELTMDSKSLRALERNPRSDETHPAVFRADGEIYTNVQVRYRGDWARTWPKKPLKIFFSRDQPFQGHHSLNLNSAWRDAAFVRETLAYHVYAACGVPASRSRMVSLRLNGQFHGLYVEVEQVDKTLLRRFNLKGASLFKTTSQDNQADERDLGSEAAFAGHYENETQGTNGLSELRRFCHELARATNTLEFFNRYIDLEKYINYLAANALVQNWDCFDKNHFVVYDRRGSQKWFSMPWDLDRTFGDHWNGGFDRADIPMFLGTHEFPRSASWNRIQDRFFREPTLRARFLNRLAELLETEFTPARLFPVLDRLESSLRAEAAQDRRRWPGPDEDLPTGISEVKSYIERRRTYLQRELTRQRQAR